MAWAVPRAREHRAVINVYTFVVDLLDLAIVTMSIHVNGTMFTECVNTFLQVQALEFGAERRSRQVCRRRKAHARTGAHHC